MLVAVSFGPTAHGASAPQLRILYAGDWTGSMQIFAADPSGATLGQLTFARPEGACYSPTACGFTRPLPSPDGAQLAFFSKEGRDYAFAGQTLYLARADGTGARALGQAATAAWSPDSQRFAYSVQDGTHVLSGGRDRVVFGPGAAFLRYSPDGRTLGIVKGNSVYLLRRGHSHAVAEDALAGFAWSPDGRSIAYPSSQGITIVTVGDGQSRLVYTPTQSERYDLWRGEVGFSPNGRYLAIALGVIHILDLRTGHVLLVRASGHDISWLPDGRLLYVAGSEDTAGDEIATGDVQTVTPHGHISTVVSAAKPYGGQIVAVAWTTAATGVRYSSPQQVDGIFAGGPVQELAADGSRVAFSACGGVSAWTPATDSIAVVASHPYCLGPTSRDRLYALGLAGDRIVWSEKGPGLCFLWTSREATIGSSPLALGNGSGCLGSAPTDGLGTAVGSGSLLVQSHWKAHYGPGATVVDEQTIERVDPGGCPCSVLSTNPGSYAPLDVDQNRIVVSSATETRVLAADGTVLLTLPVPTAAAQLSGSDLALAIGSQLRVYDASTGTLRHTWPLPAQPVGHDCDYYGDPSCNTQPAVALGDLAHGLAVYVVDGQVHLLRISDGTDAIVAPGTYPRFADAGLVYADGGRIRLLRFAQLPLS